MVSSCMEGENWRSVLASRNSSDTGRSNQAPTRFRCEGRGRLRILGTLKTGLNSMEPTCNDHAADDNAGPDEDCPQCEAPGVTTFLHQDSFSWGLGEDRVTLHTTIPVRCCGACGFQYLDDEGMLIGHEAVCKHLGVLGPTEILAIRERHGLNRETFARITGLDEATLGKWENGAKIQGRADDNYLRLLGFPENLERLVGKETRDGRCDRNRRSH